MTAVTRVVEMRLGFFGATNTEKAGETNTTTVGATSTTAVGATSTPTATDKPNSPNSTHLDDLSDHYIDAIEGSKAYLYQLDHLYNITGSP